MVQRAACTGEEARHLRASNVEVVEFGRVLGHFVVRRGRLARVQPRRLERIRAVVEDEHVSVVRQPVLLAGLLIWIPAVEAKRLEDVVGWPLVLAVEVAQVEQELRERADLVGDERDDVEAGGPRGEIDHQFLEQVCRGDAGELGLQSGGGQLVDLVFGRR